MNYKIGSKLVIEVADKVGGMYRIKGLGLLLRDSDLDKLGRFSDEVSWAYQHGWANGRRDGMKEARCNTANRPAGECGTQEWMNIPEASDKPEKGDFRAELGLIMDTIDCIDKRIRALEKRLLKNE